jgi:hypothetical protein
MRSGVWTPVIFTGDGRRTSTYILCKFSGPTFLATPGKPPPDRCYLFAARLRLLLITDHRLPITDYRLPITDYFPPRI